MQSDDRLPIEVDVRLLGGSDAPRLTLSCSDRTSPVPLSGLLPALRSLTSTVAEAAVKREQAAGREISCKAGCGACCRQLVPLTVTEARQLSELIAGLEESHQTRVRARFLEAMPKIRDSGLWGRLEEMSSMSKMQRGDLAAEYFQLGIACPFLEEESCSIHPVRPLVCRQYLVTSAPAHCANPPSKKIVPVALAANVFGALARVEARGEKPLRSIPMILALAIDFAEDKSRETIPTWLGLLLEQIKKIREERISDAKASESGAAPMAA